VFVVGLEGRLASYGQVRRNAVSQSGLLSCLFYGKMEAFLSFLHVLFLCAFLLAGSFSLWRCMISKNCGLM